MEADRKERKLRHRSSPLILGLPGVGENKPHQGKV